MRKFIEKLRRIRHHKAACGILAGVVAITVGSAFYVLNARGEKGEEITTSVQEAVAETGSIRTTIVGTGSLATAETAKIEVPKGLVIEQIEVETGDQVAFGDVIATVTEASVAAALLEVKESIEAVQDEIDNLSDAASDAGTTEYLQKLVLQSELADLQNSESELTILLTTRSITAESDGVISSLNIEAGTTVGSSASSGGVSGSTNGAMGIASVSDGQSFSFLTAGELSEDLTAGSDETVTAITACNELNIAAPVTGAMPQSNVAVAPGSTVHYTGTVTWNTSDGVFKENTEYTATIVLTADQGYSFSENILVELNQAYLVSWQVFGSGEGNRLRIIARYEKTEAAQSAAANNDGKAVDTGNGSGGSGSSDGFSTGSASGSSGSLSGSSAGGASGSAAASGASGSDTTASSGSSVDVEDLFASVGTIAASDKMQVSINVDELDILTVKTGQTAVITLDALDGGTFEGIVERISSEASSTDGSTKYTVEVILDRDDDMLLGMSASATININEVENAVLIPVNAIQESGDKVFVYTQDDEEGNLSGEVEIETGVSDGSRVEVISGLSSGDSVYYLKSDSSQSDAEAMFGGEMPSGMEMPNGGEVPSGGEMPSRGEMPGGGMSGGGMPGGGPGGE